MKADSQIPSEQVLVERCRRGDRDAQRELYERTGAPIYRLLLKMTRNHEDACDLLQDTFIKGFERIDRFDGRASIATWLYSIGVHEALRFLRRNRTLQAKLETVVHAPVNGRAWDEVATERLDVHAALATLDPSEQAILLLRHQEGLNYSEIAVALECAPGTVGSRLNRARGRLREILRKSYGPGEESTIPAHPSSSA